MNEKDLKFINEHLYRNFLYFMESADASRLAESITDVVADDIMDTADPNNWNSSDINIALSRQKKRRDSVASLRQALGFPNMV